LDDRSDTVDAAMTSRSRRANEWPAGRGQRAKDCRGTRYIPIRGNSQLSAEG
jgi:hypothetical protein